MRVGMLISVQFLVTRLGPRAARVCAKVSHLGVLLFLMVIIVYGWKLSVATLGQPSPALQMPMGIAYFGIVVGCAVMALHTVALLVVGEEGTEGG